MKTCLTGGSAASADTDPKSTAAEKEAARGRLRALSSGRMYRRLFLGNVGGSIGETSCLALLLGALLLFGRRIISWRIPLSFLGATALAGLVLWVPGASRPCTGDPLFHVPSGGVVLGAFFMATDMVTTPLSTLGQVVFAVGCGILTAVIRLYGGYQEGVCYSILIMNTAVPLIDRFTRPRVLGTGGVTSS